MSDNEGIVKSNFRNSLDNYQIVVSSIYYSAIVIFVLIVQFGVFYIFDKTWVMNVIYFFVGIGRLVGVGEKPLNVLLALNVIAYLIALSYFITTLIPKRIKIYQTCPDCGGSVIVYEDWLCSKCERPQEKDRYVTDNCRWCKQKLDQIRCDRCGIRIDL